MTIFNYENGIPKKEKKIKWAKKQKKYLLDFINGCDPEDETDQMKLHFVYMEVKHEETRSLDTPQHDPFIEC